MSSTVWADFSARFLPSRPIDDEDVIGRFLFDPSHFDRNPDRVRAAAFLPGPDDTTSVYRTTRLSEGVIWGIGKTVGKTWRKPLQGRADVKVGVVLQVRPLRVTLDNSPRHHAFIHDWPPKGSQTLGKNARKILALEIAAEAKLVPLPA